MLKQDRYDSLIQYYTEKHSELDWLIIKAVIKQESSFNPIARSSADALGLMQLLRGTGRDMGVADWYDLLDPERNIKAGIKYLWECYKRYPEIPDDSERLRFACAAYNAGRGNINKMLEYARASESLESSYKKGKKKGSIGGKWQTWGYSKRFLSLVTGDHSKETLTYITRIEKYYRKYREIVDV